MSTLTGLIPTIYGARDIVSRGLQGMITSVRRDASFERMALNQSFTFPKVATASAVDRTPSHTVPAYSEQTIGYDSMSLTKDRYVPIPWTAEQEKQANSPGGVGVNTILQDQFAQAMVTLTNEIETDLCALHVSASRAYGTAGTAPFQTANDYTDASFVDKILNDNGAPQGNRFLVIDNTSAAYIKGRQAAVNTAGTSEILRQGMLLDINGFTVKASGKIQTHTKGTAASATTNTAGYAIGATTITLASAGTGTLLAGDAITFAGDTNVYILASGDADVSGGGTIVLNEPGLRKAIPGSATAITVIATSNRQLAFDQNAIILATRLPAKLEKGDLATDSMVVTDTRSGLSFDVSYYPGFGQGQLMVGIAWGVKMLKKEHTAVLLGANG